MIWPLLQTASFALPFLAWPGHAAGAPCRASIPRGSRPSRPGSAAPLLRRRDPRRATRVAQSGWASRPTMREFAADPETTVHPQTVIEHFGSWNAAKRAAGLVPSRFATREELVRLLAELGDELGRVPTARDLDERRGHDALEVALLAHVRLAHAGAARGGLRRAGGGGARRPRRRAGRGPRAAARPPAEVRRLGRRAARRRRRCSRSGRSTACSTRGRGAWATFQFLVAEKLSEEGVEVSPEGRLER